MKLLSLSAPSRDAAGRVNPTGARRLDPSLSSLPRSSAAALREIRRSSADSVLLISGSLTLVGLAILAYCTLRRVLTVSFFYGRDVLLARRDAVGKLLLSCALQMSTVIAVNSRYTQGLLGPAASEAVVVYPSIDPSILDGLEPAADAPRGARVLFVGRLVRRKGADLLLEAFAEVVRQFPAATLEIVGVGPDREPLVEASRRLGILDRVDFRGSLVGLPLYESYNRCTVLALPSRETPVDVEGFGTVFIEAGAFGKPVVGTRTGGIPEAVLDEKTGLLVPDDDPRALARAIMRMLGDRELRRSLGDEGRRRAISEFNLSHTMDVLEGAIHK